MLLWWDKVHTDTSHFYVTLWKSLHHTLVPCISFSGWKPPALQNRNSQSNTMISNWLRVAISCLYIRATQCFWCTLFYQLCKGKQGQRQLFQSGTAIVMIDECIHKCEKLGESASMPPPSPQLPDKNVKIRHSDITSAAIFVPRYYKNHL